MKIILPLFTLSFIGLLSYFNFIIYQKYFKYYINRNTNFIIFFSSILVFIDNFSQVYDIQNINPIDNYEHIKIIGIQALEIQYNKLLYINYQK